MKKHIINSAVCALLLIILSNTFVLAQDQPLYLKCEIDKRDYLLAEPIWIRCSLVNKTTDDVVIPFHQYGTVNTFIITVTDVDGNKMTKAILERSSMPRPFVIKSGEHIANMYSLFDEFDISKPGRYFISVLFISDGKCFRGSGSEEMEDKSVWKGELTLNVGEVNIINPQKEEDIKALRALDIDESKPFPYQYVFSENDKRKKLIEEYPDSIYTGYAKYYEGLELYYADRFIDLPEDPLDEDFAKKALAYLNTIDTSKYGTLFKENIAYYSTICHKYANSKPADIDQSYNKLKKEFPNSVYLQKLNIVLGIQEMPTSQDSNKIKPDNGDKSKDALGKNQGNTIKKKTSKNDSDSNTDGSANILFIIGGIAAGLLIIGLIIAIRSRKRSA